MRGRSAISCDLPRPRSGPEKITVGRRVMATHSRSEQLVYVLYGLTEREAQIVGGEQR